METSAPRDLLRAQGLHPHPGPMQEAVAAEDEGEGFDPDAYLFLGADPTQYGLSPLDRQGPPEIISAGPSDTINDSETSEEELIEDCSDNQPPNSFSITGRLQASGVPDSLIGMGIRPGTTTYVEEGERR